MPRGLGRLGRRGLLVQLASVVPRATGETLDRWGPQGRRDRGGGQDREVTWVLLGLLAGWVSKGRWDRREWDLQVPYTFAMVPVNACRGAVLVPVNACRGAVPC